MQGSTKRRRHSSFFLDLPKVLVVWFFKTYCDPCIACIVWLAHCDPRIHNVENARRLLMSAAFHNNIEMVEMVHTKWIGRQTLFTFDEALQEAIKGDAVQTCLFLRHRCMDCSIESIVKSAAKWGRLKILDYYKNHLFDITHAVATSGNISSIEWFLQCGANFNDIIWSAIHMDHVHVLEHFKAKAEPLVREQYMAVLRHGATQCLEWTLNAMPEKPSNLDLLEMASAFPADLHMIQWLTSRGFNAPLHLITRAVERLAIQELFEGGCELHYHACIDRWADDDNGMLRWVENQIARPDVERVGGEGDIFRKI